MFRDGSQKHSASLQRCVWCNRSKFGFQILDRTGDLIFQFSSPLFAPPFLQIIPQGNARERWRRWPIRTAVRCAAHYQPAGRHGRCGGGPHPHRPAAEDVRAGKVRQQCLYDASLFVRPGRAGRSVPDDTVAQSAHLPRRRSAR